MENVATTKRARKPDPHATQLALKPVAYFVMLACCDASLANPVGPQVVSGTVTMQRPNAQTLNVTNSPSSIINWQGFSIGANEVTRFIQQSSASAVLNRVVGADISRIQGQLVSNGQVFLVNPAGIIVGPGAVIDTAGFVGSTLRMQDADFLAGKLKFEGDAGAGAIVNQGWIKAGHNGNVVLVAPNIQNSGVIETQGGEIVLAAGQKLTIANRNLDGIQFEIQAPTDSVLNVGKLLAEDGAVGIFAGTLRHSGDIRANALTRDAAGRVVLKAQGDVTLAAGSATRADGKIGGAITVQSGSGMTRVSGDVSATGSEGSGGIVHLLGRIVALEGAATLNASGETGGGTILVGGDYQGSNAAIQNAWRTFVGRDARLRADAVTSGNGGKIVVWADDATQYYGDISARGGAHTGDGGFVEVSGKRHLDFRGTVDTRAPHGNAGTLLLDPSEIRIVATDDATVPDTDCTGGCGTVGASTYQDTGAPDPTSEITVATLSNALTNGNVLIDTNTTTGATGTGDILFNADLNFNGIGTPRTLTLNANRNIVFNNRIFDGTAGGDTLNLVMTASNDITVGAIAGNPATTTIAANAFTADAGRSILINGTISSLNADITLRGNNAFAGRGAGAAVVTMVPSTRILALGGTPGIVRLSLLAGNAGTTGGDITIADLVGASVSVYNNNATRAVATGSSILKAAALSGITVLNGGTVHLEIEAPAGGMNSSIGTSALPISVSPSGGGNVILEAHYHGGGAGIFIATTAPLQIGGAAPAVFSGGVKGVQTIGAGGVPAGPISLSALTLTQLGGTAICGSMGGTGGPICSGGATASTDTRDITTLRANDMDLQRPVTGNRVVLLSNNIPIVAGTPAGPAGTLWLGQAEIDLITTTALQIGGRQASGDFINSGNITFAAGGLSAPPGGATMEFRSGAGSIISGGGTTDINTAANNNNIILIGQSIGAAGNRLKFSPGTGSIDLTTTNGNAFIQRSVGDLVTNNTAFSQGTTSPPLILELATTDGDIMVTGGFTASGTGGGADIRFVAGGAGRNIVFGAPGASTASGVSFTLTPGTGGSTMFSGGQVFNLPVITSSPIVVNGGNVAFNSTVAGPGATPAGALSVTSGTATFTSGTASTFGGLLTVSGTGTLAGTGPLNATNGLTFSGGTISNTGGIMVTGGTTASGTPQLTGMLNTDTIGTVAGSTLTIASGTPPNGLLIVRGASGMTNFGTIANAGTVRMTGGGQLLFDAGGGLNNSGTFDFQSDASILGAGAGAPTITNSGTLRKSAGGLSRVGFAGGVGTNVIFTNSGTLDAQIGTLELGGNNNTFSSGTVFTDSGVAGAGVNLVTGNSTFNTAGAAITSTNLTLGGSATTTYGGTATLGGTVIWTDGMVTGGMSNPGTGTWNLNGTQPKIIDGNFTFTNAGIMNLNGGSLRLQGGTIFQNNGSFNLVGDFSIQNVGAVTFRNDPSGAVLAKTGGMAVSQIGSDNLLSFRNGVGPTNAGTIRVVAPAGMGTPTIQMNGTFVGNTNHGTIDLGANTAFGAGASFTTNNGLITVGNNAVFLTTANTFTNARSIFLTNGTFSLNDGTPATNNNSLVNSGSTALIRGTGGIVMGAGGTVTNTNNASLAPGSSPGILVISGNYMQTSTGGLLIELGGTLPGSGSTNHDQLQVTGNVSLNGPLFVSFFGGFTGAPGNAYEIVTTSTPGAISGNFSSISPPTGFSTSTGTFSNVLTQTGGSSSPSTPSPSSSSNSGSMQMINDVLATSELDTMPPQEQVLVDQRKGLSARMCAPGS